MQTAFLRAYLLTVDTGSMAEAARRLNLTPAHGHVFGVASVLLQLETLGLPARGGEQVGHRLTSPRRVLSGGSQFLGRLALGL